mmetsp:Transcript_11643/g.16157  ORF Transcript_11643/g.16157 Transcript_11643/m.16157 type:complete len:157 (-) Transcript_11643:20-490(-)
MIVSAPLYNFAPPLSNTPSMDKSTNSKGKKPRKAQVKCPGNTCQGYGAANSQCTLKLCKKCCLQQMQQCTYTAHALHKVHQSHGEIIEKINNAMQQGIPVWFNYTGGEFPNTIRMVENLRWEMGSLVFAGDCAERGYRSRTYNVTKVARLEYFAFQ